MSSEFTSSEFGVAQVAGVCRICRCTEQSPCVSAEPRPGMEPVIARCVDEDGGELEMGYFVCAWADDDRTLCSNPDCIHQAYLQACGSSSTRLTSISI